MRTKTVQTGRFMPCDGVALQTFSGSRYNPIMIKREFLDSLVHQVMDSLPGRGSALTRDLENNLRAAMQGVFNRLDLVTREEFEIQSELLARSRTRLEQLEKQVAELEARLKSRN